MARCIFAIIESFIEESKADAHFDTRDEIPRYTTVFARVAIGWQKNFAHLCWGRKEDFVLLN